MFQSMALDNSDGAGRPRPGIFLEVGLGKGRSWCVCSRHCNQESKLFYKKMGRRMNGGYRADSSGKKVVRMKMKKDFVAVAVVERVGRCREG